MKQFIHYIINRHQEIIKYFLILTAILLIVFWLPEGGKFKYEFSKGKVWQYEDLYAPFDFAVEKNQGDIKEEEKGLLAAFIPYYNVAYNKDQLKTTFDISYNEAFQNVLENKKAFSIKKSQITKDSAIHANKAYNTLIKVIAEGYMTDEDLQLLKNQEQKYINCLVGNIASKRKVKELKTKEELIKKVVKELVEQSDYPLLYSGLIQPVIYNIDLPIIQYDDEINNELKSDLFGNIEEVKSLIQKNELIISKGARIDEQHYEGLTALKDVYEKGSIGIRSQNLTALGFFILSLLAMSILMAYLYLYQPQIFGSNRNIIYILTIIVGFIYLIGWINELNQSIFTELSTYVIPVCIIPIVIRAFFDSRTAIFTTVSVILITGYIVPNSFEYVVLNFIACFFAIFSTRNLHYLSQFYQTAVIILITYFLGYFGTILIHNGSIEEIDYTIFGWFTLNALLTLLAFPLISIFEKIFGLVSEITIFELSDLNKPLLKQLSLKAPGTFQHSLQVSNLAEAAASEIGANPLLTRVGALYHDVGKIYNPTYFIENQITGINPHNELNFEDSAKIIIDHVIKGIELAKSHKLPDIIIDFIRTHHGDTRVEYFYQSYLKNYPDKEINEAKFKYPGPIPFSKETACLMMADSVEAASRSLKNPSEEDINKLVDGIVEFKVSKDQFINCDITFRDITKVKKLFKKMLKSIYHVRISYPDAN